MAPHDCKAKSHGLRHRVSEMFKKAPPAPSSDVPPIPPLPQLSPATPKPQQQSCVPQKQQGNPLSAVAMGEAAENRVSKPHNEHQAGAGPSGTSHKPSPIPSTLSTFKTPPHPPDPALVMSNPPQSEKQVDIASDPEKPKGKFFPHPKDDSAYDATSRLAVQKLLSNLSGYMYKPQYEHNNLRTEAPCEQPELMEYDKKRMEEEHKQEAESFRKARARAESNVGAVHDDNTSVDVYPWEPQEDTTSINTVVHCPHEKLKSTEKPRLPEDYDSRSKAAKKRARQKARKKDKDILPGEKAAGAGAARDFPVVIGWPAGVKVPERLTTPVGRDETFSTSHAVKVVERASVSTELSSAGRDIVLRSQSPPATAPSSRSVSVSKIPRPRTQSALSSARSARSDGSTPTIVPLHKPSTPSDSSPLRFLSLPLPKFDDSDSDEDYTTALFKTTTNESPTAKDAIPDEFTKLLASDLVHPWPDMWENHQDDLHTLIAVPEDADAYEQIRQLLIDVWMALTGQKKATQRVTDIFVAMLHDIPSSKRSSKHSSFNDKKRSSKDTSFEIKTASNSSAVMPAAGPPKTPFARYNDSPLGSLALKSPLETRLSLGSNRSAIAASFEKRNSGNSGGQHNSCGQRNSLSIFSPNHIIAERKDSAQWNSDQSGIATPNRVVSGDSSLSQRNSGQRSQKSSGQSTTSTRKRFVSGHKDTNQRNSDQSTFSTPGRVFPGHKDINQRSSGQSTVATQSRVVSGHSAISTPKRVVSGQKSANHRNSDQIKVTTPGRVISGHRSSGQRNSGQNTVSTPNRPVACRKETNLSAASASTSGRKSITMAKTKGKPVGNLKNRKPNLSIRTSKSTADLRSPPGNSSMSLSTETPTPTKRNRLASLGNLFTPKKSPRARSAGGNDYFTTTPTDAPPMPKMPAAFARSTSHFSHVFGGPGPSTPGATLFARSTSQLCSPAPPTPGTPREASVSFSSSVNTVSSKKSVKKEKKKEKPKPPKQQKGKAAQGESGIDPAIFEELLEELIVAFTHWHNSNNPASFPLTGLAVQAARALVAYTSATLDSLQDEDRAWDEAEQFNARLTWIADNPTRSINDCPIPKLPELDPEYIHAGHADVWAMRFLAWAEEQDELCRFIERDAAAAAVNEDDNKYDDNYDHMKNDDDESTTDGNGSPLPRLRKHRPSYAVHGGMGARCEDLKRRLDWCEIDATLGTCIDDTAVVTPANVEAAEAAGEGRPLAPLAARQRFEKLIAVVGNDARWAVCVEQIARLAGLVGRDAVAAMEAKRLVKAWQERRAIEKAERERRERQKRHEIMVRKMTVGMARKGIAPKRNVANLKIRSGEEAKREVEAKIGMEMFERERKVEEKEKRSAEKKEKGESPEETEKKDAAKQDREAKSKAKGKEVANN